MSRVEEEFGRIVRKRRQGIGLSQEEFADRAGIHRTYVSMIERGKVQVGIGVAFRLAEALGIQLSRLIQDVERTM
jgi:transcriptional regulator with XRE-family HTH domain